MDKSNNFGIAVLSTIFAVFGAAIVGVLMYYTERIENTVSEINAEIVEVKQIIQ